ncbi:hypothetical protein VC116059_003195A, partial [Vibrio cholerae O1 str. 116059]|jgi:hypothetical protein
MLC